MGVGINYRGVGGNRHFDLNGLPTGEADALFKTPRRHKQLLPENFKKALHPMPTDPIAKENEGKVKLNAFDMRPDTLDKKTMPGSAVTASMSGLCLEGEQENPSVVGTKLYGSHGGKKGYHAFNDFDPPVEGGRVGALGAGGEGADNSIAKAGAPFAYQVSSRVVMETDDLGRQILVEYDKDVQNTALGRTHTVTGERRRIICVIDKTSTSTKFHTPFEIQNTEDGVKIVNCVFWVDGAERVLGDYPAPKDGFVFLVGKNKKDGSSASASDEADALDIYLSNEESAEESIFCIKLYEFSNGEVIKDFRDAPLILSSADAEADNTSIDKKGGKSKDALELAHFADKEMDSSKGLANRLRVDTESGKIVSQDDSLMLVARKSGKLIYIPLGGSDEGEDPVHEDEGVGDDPCAHPGGGGSVSPDDDGTPSQNGGGAVSKEEGSIVTGVIKCP